MKGKWMSETTDRDESGRLQPGHKSPGYGVARRDVVRAWNYDAAANRLVKEACASEAMDVLPELRALMADERPAVQILAMEAILRLACGRPNVARQVKAEVYRLTGQQHPYKTILSWPDGHLKGIDGLQSLDLLDREPQSPQPAIYTPPLDHHQANQDRIARQEHQITTMEAELEKAASNYRELQTTLGMAKQELELLKAGYTDEPARQEQS
jgi:hypothetical protein